jgi:hypothetical protein
LASTPPPLRISSPSFRTIQPEIVPVLIVLVCPLLTTAIYAPHRFGRLYELHRNDTPRKFYEIFLNSYERCKWNSYRGARQSGTARHPWLNETLEHAARADPAPGAGPFSVPASFGS